MSIRPATWKDLPAIASACAAAFHDDELFGAMMHPYRDKYPKDYRRYFLMRSRQNWFDRTHVVFVATVTETIDGITRETVVGVAEWERRGSVSNALPWWDPRRMLKPTVTFCNRLTLMVSPNRAANSDPMKRNPFEAALGFSAHYWNGARSNTYYLDLLCIHPDYQGRGLGRELVQWGLKQADIEGVYTSVVASDTAASFYKHVGLNIEVGYATEGKNNPLNDLKGGMILFKNCGERQPPSD